MSKIYINNNRFLKVILPKSDQALRIMILTRNQNDNPYLDIDIQNIKKKLAEILKIEIHLANTIKVMSSELWSFSEFTVHEAFSCIDINKFETIEEISLQIFLQKYGFEFQINELLLLTSRLDRDDDKKVSYIDFEELFYYPNDSAIKYNDIRTKNTITINNESPYNSLITGHSLSKKMPFSSSVNDRGIKNSDSYDNNLLSFQTKFFRDDYLLSSRVLNTESEVNSSSNGFCKSPMNYHSFSSRPKTAFKNISQEHNILKMSVKGNSNENPINSFRNIASAQDSLISTNFQRSRGNYISDKIMAFERLYKQNSQQNDEMNHHPTQLSARLNLAYNDTYTLESEKRLSSQTPINIGDNQNHDENVNIIANDLNGKITNDNIINNNGKNILETNDNSNNRIERIINDVGNSQLSTSNNDPLSNNDNNKVFEIKSSDDDKGNKSNPLSSKNNKLNIETCFVLTNDLNLCKTKTKLFNSEEISDNVDFEELFAIFLGDVLNMYYKLERIRETLNIDKGIYLDDLYKFFDKDNDKCITFIEFHDKLKEMGVAASYEEVKLIFKRYDFDQNLFFRYYECFYTSYNEFCAMINSKNPEYKTIISDRKSGANDMDENFKYFKKSFILKKFFRILIECENNLEAKRRLLVDHPNFSLIETYNIIKKDSENVIILDDV